MTTLTTFHLALVILGAFLVGANAALAFVAYYERRSTLVGIVGISAGFVAVWAGLQ